MAAAARRSAVTLGPRMANKRPGATRLGEGRRRAFAARALD